MAESEYLKGPKVLALVNKFVEDNKISCPEVIYDSDRVIENAYTFIHALCDIAGYYKYKDEN